MLTLGTASGGQQIRLDTNSIQRNGNAGSWWSGFTYYLGNERLEAGAHCGRGIFRRLKLHLTKTRLLKEAGFLIP